MTSKQITCAAILCTLLFFNLAFGSDEESNNIGDIIQVEHFEQIMQLERLTNPQMLFADDFNDFPMFDEELYQMKHHSTGRAFLYSLLLPGAGELYTGSKLKAAFFFGVEVFSWYQYVTNYGDGQDLEDQYRDYANQYWNPGDYRAWLIDEVGIPADSLPYINEEGEEEFFTHHLPGFKTQQYYEMIGKYDQFVYGWEDTDYASGDSLSENHRIKYLSMRQESNSKFDTARNYAIVSIANRVISAFDAALSARRLNKKADRFSEVRLKARLADYHGEKIPKLVFTYKFF